MTTAATTTRPAIGHPNSANTPKHAFAPFAPFGPRSSTASNVTLPAQRPNLDLWPGQLASETSRHDFYVSVGAGSQTAVLVHNCPSSANNYRANFTSENDMPDDFQVHHSLPQQYSDLFDDSDVNIHDNEYLRGVDQATHQQITNSWRAWGAANASPSAGDVMGFANQIDEQFGGSMIFPGG
jgi:hypothetical protein